MLNIIGPEVAGAGNASAGLRQTSGLQGIFAQLLASSGAPAPAGTAPPTALREIQIPGDGTAQRGVRERLGAVLEGVVDWAAATAAQGVARAGGSGPDGDVETAANAVLPGFGPVADVLPRFFPLAVPGAPGPSVAPASGASVSAAVPVDAGRAAAAPGLVQAPGAPAGLTIAAGLHVAAADAGQPVPPGAAAAAGGAAPGTPGVDGQAQWPFASSPAPGADGVNMASIPAQGRPAVLSPPVAAPALPQPSGGLPFTTQLADRLAVVLRSFDAANDTDTRAVLAANAAGQPALTLMPGTPEDQAKAMVAAVRGLLGLDVAERPDGAVLAPSAPVLARVPGARSLADLVARIAAPAAVTEGVIPEGRAVEALRTPAPAARRMAAAGGGLQGLLAQQLNGLAMTGETARVRLLPAGLGAVQITVSATGMATVQADNPRVLSALREMPGQIAAILEQAGVPVRAGAISFGAMGRTAVQARDVPAAVTGDTADVPGEPVRAVKPQADPRPVSGRAPPDPVALARVEPALSAPEARPPADPLPQRPTEPAIAPQGSRPHEHLASHVTGQLKGQRVAEGTTRIALSPQGLGTLEIELARDDAGALRVVVRAENPAVLGALRDNREGLLGVLRDSGHGVQDSGLGFEAFGREGRPQHRAEPGGTGFVEAEEDEPEAAVIPVALADGRIDIIT